MSLSNLAAIGSFVSGIAVFLSFIFLSLQLRQANRNQRSLMQQARTSRNVEILLKMADSEISETLAQASANCASMTDAKIWSFYGFGAAVFWSYEDCFLQFKAKTLDPSSWASDVATLKRLVAYPPYRAVWKMARDGMGGDYRDYVDCLMAKIPSDKSRSLTEVFKICIGEELEPAPAPQPS
jgi:hypothetical protein